jgi:hypothetical protein
MAARSVYTISRREEWQCVFKTWLSGSLLGLLLMGGVAFAYWIIPNNMTSDLRGAITQQGIGTVTSFAYESADNAGYHSPDHVGILLNGHSASYSGPRFLLLRTGQQVQVTYRIGKSGNVYVDDIQPGLDTKQ